MNRLVDNFAQLRHDGRRVLMPYITAGYPDAATTIEILKRLDPRRVGCVEVGIPFSDPIADGPVIQASFSNALSAGFRVGEFFEALGAARRDIPVPLVAMVSYSIVYRREPARFIEQALAAGFEGMLVPDLAWEEAHDLSTLCDDHDFALVQMVAPTSGPARRAHIAALSEPFIYYQALRGVTGERDALPADLRDGVAALRSQTDKPICVGFGISRPEHVASVCEIADGAIVGSAIVRRLNEGLAQQQPQEQLVDSVVALIGELAAAVPQA